MEVEERDVVVGRLHTVLRSAGGYQDADIEPRASHSRLATHSSDKTSRSDAILTSELEASVEQNLLLFGARAIAVLLCNVLLLSAVRAVRVGRLVEKTLNGFPRSDFVWKTSNTFLLEHVFE